MRLIQECLNLLEVVYPEGPVPELIFAEALIYNDAIRQHLAQFSSAVSDILCSLGKLLLTSVSARLDTALGEEYQPQAEDEIQFHTTCIDDAREHLLKMVITFFSRSYAIERTIVNLRLLFCIVQRIQGQNSRVRRENQVPDAILSVVLCAVSTVKETYPSKRSKWYNISQVATVNAHFWEFLAACTHIKRTGKITSNWSRAPGVDDQIQRLY